MKYLPKKLQHFCCSFFWAMIASLDAIGRFEVHSQYIHIQQIVTLMEIIK